MDLLLPEVLLALPHFQGLRAPGSTWMIQVASVVPRLRLGSWLKPAASNAGTRVVVKLGMVMLKKSHL